MSESTEQNQFAQVNPYSAPKNHARLDAKRMRALLISGIVVAGFASACVFTYWQFSGRFIHREPYHGPKSVTAAELLEPLSERIPPGRIPQGGIPLRPTTGSPDNEGSQQANPGSPSLQP